MNLAHRLTIEDRLCAENNLLRRELAETRELLLKAKNRIRRAAVDAHYGSCDAWAAYQLGLTATCTCNCDDEISAIDAFLAADQPEAVK